MALNACQSCTTKFAVGLKRCPHCGSTDFCEDGQMAKITERGPSDKTLAAVEGGARVTEPAPMAVDKPSGGATVPSRDALREHARNLVEPDFSESLAQRENEKGGEESSPGSNSPASTETPQPNSEPSEPSSPKRARTTASRSKKAPTANPSAPSTAGAQTGATSAADSTEA